MFRKYGGKLLIVASGGGCLALVFFVVAPRLFEPAPPVAQDEIVAEALGTDVRQADEGELEDVMPVPAPLVGIRNDGAEVAVILPAAEPRAEELNAAADANSEEENGLPLALSAADVAEARAALAGDEPEPFPAVVEPDSAAAMEGEAGTAILPQEADAGIVPPVAETPGESEEEASLSALPARQAEAVEEEPEPVAVAAALPVERAPAGGRDRPANAARLEFRRGEFDMPVWSNSRTPLEVSHPSGGVLDDAAPRITEAGFVVPGTLCGVMGYRLPLISRQEVPDQIVSGVLIPAHTTFVILKEGSWELVDVTPEELERFREAVAQRETPAAEVGPVRRGWNPLRVFRKRKAPEAQRMDVGQKKR